MTTSSPLIELNNDDEESNIQSECSSPTFSYFSIASSSDEEDKPGFSTILSCMKSSMRWKASLLKKRERESKPELTEEDIKFLTTNTNYSEEEIRQWFREFIKDCPEGALTVEKVKEMMNFILPDQNGEIVANLIFSAFEVQINGNKAYQNPHFENSHSKNKYSSKLGLQVPQGTYCLM